MNKGSMYIFAFVAGILLLVVGILVTNPDYGDLTEEETRIVDQAIGNLLNSGKGITLPMISVVSFTPRDYADASLDCPQPDQMYAQVITPGYQVVLSANGASYDYRVAGETVILCE